MPRHDRVKCPQCSPFKKPSLSIDRLLGLFHCFRCGYSGRNRGGFRLDLMDEAYGSRHGELTLPDEFTPLDPYSPKSLRQKFALNYLEKRRVTKEQIEKYQIGFCEKGRFENRIIIPFFTGDFLTYFVARTINKNESRKYLNPRAPKGSFVFKTYTGKVSCAAIVEGVFDALSVEHIMPAIALLGKKPTQAQIDSIKHHTERAILILDSDAHKDSIELKERISFHVPTANVLLKTSDPGALTKGELSEYIGFVS